MENLKIRNFEKQIKDFEKQIKDFEKQIRKENRSKKHGKVFENYISTIFDYNQSKKVNAFWDAYTKDGVPVSIKTTKKTKNKLSGDIMLADMISQGKLVNRDFWLIIGEWEDNFLNIVSVKAYYIKASVWNSFFNGKINLYVEALKRIEHLAVNINSKKNPKFDEELKFYNKCIEIAKDYWVNNTKNIIKPRPKKDCTYVYDAKEKRYKKKGSNRIQCAISKKDLERYFGHTVRTLENWDLNAYHKYIEQFEMTEVEVEVNVRVKGSAKVKVNVNVEVEIEEDISFESFLKEEMLRELILEN